MANDDKFIVTTTWQKIEANGSPITNGVFTVFARVDNRVELLKTDTPPNENEIGASYLRMKRDRLTFNLSNMENLYAKTGHGASLIGVIDV